MGIFTKNKMKPYFIFSQKGNIWRMHFSPGDILVCETRDLTTKETYFFSLNYKSKQIYFSNFQLDEKWWISVESVNDNLIFFNNFKTPELPEHIGITAVDIRTGKTMWVNRELSFLFADSSDVYAYSQQFEREVFHKLSGEDGRITETYDDEKIASSLLELKSFNEEKMYAAFIYPEIFLGKHGVDDAAESYFNSRFTSTKYFGELEFARFRNLLIYNFHEDMGVDIKDVTRRNLVNKLEIYDLKSSKLLHEEVLNADAINYVPDAFFIRDGLLFYIKEKKELVLTDLNF